MSVRRFDRGSYQKATKTPEGYLIAPAYITRTGVFEYRRSDGKIVRELRLPEDVFKPEALASFELSPITDEHPPEWLDAKNTGKFARGTLGETVKPEGEHVATRVKITDADLVAKIESGEARELSCGYTADLEERAGVWNGLAYDVIQRNIRGNHVAVVPAGRAGPSASVRLDASDGIMVSPEGARTAPQTQETNVSMRKKKIDGVDYEVPEAAAQAVEKLERTHADEAAKKDARIAELEAAEKKAKAEASALQAKLDTATEEKKKADEALKAATDPKALKAAIASRAKLEAVAKKVLGKKAKIDAKDDDELRREVLAKAHPKRDLEKKDAAYIAAAWDQLVEKLDNDEDDDGDDSVDDVRETVDGADEDDDQDDDEDDDSREDESDELDEDEPEEDEEERADSKKKKLTPAEAREKMIRDSKDLWKGEAPKKKKSA